MAYDAYDIVVRNMIRVHTEGKRDKVEPLYRGHHWDPAGCPVYIEKYP